MAKSVNKRQADQKIRDLKIGIIKMSVKVDVKIFGSIKKITKVENKTFKEVVGELLAHSINHRNDA